MQDDLKRLFLLKSDLVGPDDFVEKGKLFEGLKLVRSYINVEERDGLFLTVFHLREDGFPDEQSYLLLEAWDFKQLELLLREFAECTARHRNEYIDLFSYFMPTRFSFWFQRVLLKLPSELWPRLDHILEGIADHQLSPPHWLWYCDQDIRKTVPSWLDEAQVCTQLPAGSNEDVSLLVNLSLIKQRLGLEDFEKFLELYVPPPILCSVASLPQTDWEHWCGRDVNESVVATQQLVPTLLGRLEYNEKAFAHLIYQLDVLHGPFAKALAEEIVRWTEFNWLDANHDLARKADTVKFRYSGQPKKRAYLGNGLPSKRVKRDT